MKRFENIGVLLTMLPALAGDREDAAAAALGRVEDGAVLVDDAGAVLAAGPAHVVPSDLAGIERIDLGGAAVMPGLVESHTHLVHAGDRLLDFVERCRGVSYEAIAQRGGGIQTTVRATRAASEDALVEDGLARLDAFLAEGVTTLEVKSGYGLDTETELKMLRAARRLDEAHAIDVVPTFLGAHTVPTAFGTARERYLDMLLHEMLPEVARLGLAEFCDVFCERTAFSVAESRAVLEAGRALGLRPKLHAEQLSRSGGALLAAELAAVSADHLEHANDEDIAALAASGTVATLLPGASLFLGLRAYAPARRFLEGGVEVALSTDFNPGSCNTLHPWLMGTLACVQMGLAPHEALRALTVGGARALARADRVGALAPGYAADLVVLDVRRPEEALYRMASSPVRAVYKRGRLVFGGGVE